MLQLLLDVHMSPEAFMKMISSCLQRRTNCGRYAASGFALSVSNVQPAGQGDWVLGFLATADLHEDGIPKFWEGWLRVSPVVDAQNWRLVDE
jgi:hypothetical protein